MNEEIKEILDDMKQIPADESWALNLEDYQCKALLNYITNIQEELKKEKRINNDLIPWFKNREKELKKQINVLQKENKHLKETNEEHRKINGDLRKENQKLVKENDIIKDTLAKIKDLNARQYLNEDNFKYSLSEILKEDNYERRNMERY